MISNNKQGYKNEINNNNNINNNKKNNINNINNKLDLSSLKKCQSNLMDNN